jgi:peptidoglycan hydrolase-like protein with peptidoglycan-binding domain
VVSGSEPAAAPAGRSVPTATARVTRGDVTERVQAQGTLDFGGSRQVLSQLPAGILTSTARSGRTVGRGDRLFTVAGTPAHLMYGVVPAYRDFVLGMTDGPDVRQLERNLVALGLDPDDAIAIDDHFDWATRAAVVRWQAARGVQRTGTVPLGQVVFLRRRLRIERRAAAIGTTVAPGARVLVGTSEERVVIAQVQTDQRHLLRAGDRVRVLLPPGSGGAISGRVTRIGRAAAPGPIGAPPRVPVTVAVRLPRQARDLEQAPVQVAITSDRRRDVLMVPVSALLAAAGGGYDVRVPDRGLVAVEPGLYDDEAGTIEVSGNALREGMAVEVPAG